MKKYDFLIVGAGLFGSVFARQMSEKGKNCLVIDKRNHVAGNIYSKEIEGIQVHMYGPHIFHTDNEKVWAYVNRFARFNHFRYEPIANYKGELYHMPFNMNTFHEMWGVNTPAEAEKIIKKQRAEISTVPKNLEEQAISLVGRDIYEKLVKGYTEKQWGRDCKNLPSFIIKRLPVRMRFDNNYFNHPYQGIPVGGYTKMVENMLKGAKENPIEVQLDVDYLEDRQKWNDMAERVVYTGPIDEFYDYRYGHLEFRSLRFENEILDVSNYQGVAGMNFTDRETPYTRIVEHKHFEFGEQPKTVITREYSVEWQEGMEPYYPVNDEKNSELNSRYQELAQSEEKVIFGGRLAEYTYYDMDKVIAKSLACAETIQ
jgi:UDP-galactopyranose mutase